LTHRRGSLSNTKEKSKDIEISLNAKNKIHIRAEHLLSIILTKTSIDLIQRLSTMFTDAYKKKLSTRDDDDDEELMLSVDNMTGYQILIDQLIGLEVNLEVIRLKISFYYQVC
jgi:hypothetical protein